MYIADRQQALGVCEYYWGRYNVMCYKANADCVAAALFIAQ